MRFYSRFSAACWYRLTAGDPKRQPPVSERRPPQAELKNSLARLIEDSNATYFVAAAYIGDRLGLFKAMAGAGPLTGDQLAAKVGLQSDTCSNGCAR